MLQTPPVWQMFPAQQALPGAPQAMQVLVAPPPGLAHPKPVMQVFPVQQI
jgi:hypothetical protein